MGVWIAFEPGLRAFLGFRISYNQSILDAYLFLKELRHRYGLRENCDKEHIHNWISVFKFYHNYVRVNGEIGKAPLAYDVRLDYCSCSRIDRRIIVFGEELDFFYICSESYFD